MPLEMRNATVATSINATQLKHCPNGVVVNPSRDSSTTQIRATLASPRTEVTWSED
jgi:hypothetical protein